MGYQKLAGAQYVQNASWIYLGGDSKASPSDVALAVPSDATIVVIAAETAAVYYEINGPHANATSGGFVATNTVQVIGPLGNLTSLRIASTGTAHIQYFREG